MAKQRVGGWYAHEYNLERGKHVECSIFSITTARGAMKTFSLFKPWLADDRDNPGQKKWVPGYSLPLTEKTVRDMVDKINFACQFAHLPIRITTTVPQQAPQPQRAAPSVGGNDIPQGEPSGVLDPIHRGGGSYIPPEGESGW